MSFELEVRRSLAKGMSGRLYGYSNRRVEQLDHHTGYADFSNEESQMTPQRSRRASSGSCDPTKLQIAQSLRDYHHKALWEEEKHFTWLVSIIFTANVLLLTTDKLNLINRFLLIFLVSLIGLVICLIAFQVVRSESRNFQVALGRFIIEHNKCFENPRLPEVSMADPNRRPLDLILSGLRGQVSIRDSFQLVFVLFFLLFTLGAVGSLIALSVILVQCPLFR